jgi:lysyl-tRNA synthetase class 2
MPDKAAGVTDQEVRQRQRYLDLIVNEESRRTFRTRFEIVKYIRRFLEDEGFVEVETPTLQSIPGGASAKPFTTHHNALDTDLYMRVAPELYLKRLIVGGFERVFEIGKNFRNEGVSTKHNPEFTMVEFYQAHATYLDLMKLTQNLITDLAFQISGDYGYGKLPYGDLTIDFAKWERISYGDALMKVGVEDPWSIESLRQFIVRFDSDFNLSLGVGDLQQLIFDRWIEPQLINPTFITHYPTSFSPLARRNDDDPRVTDRFELFIAGSEIANGFSELNDPVDQAERFAIQAQMKADGDDEAMFFDEDYIRALSYGMPPTAGEGIGIDRLVMLLTNSQSIRDVILFPTMKSR